MADRDIQVPADENLRAAQAAAVVQPPPPPPPQNPEEPAIPNPQNAAREEVTLEVCSFFIFLKYRTRVLVYRIPLHFFFFFQIMLCPALKRVAL